MFLRLVALHKCEIKTPHQIQTVDAIKYIHFMEYILCKTLHLFLINMKHI